MVSHYRRGGSLRREFDRVVFDESHTIKSPGTTSRACTNLMARKRWCISATPFRDQIFKKNIHLQLKMLKMLGFCDNKMINALTYDPTCDVNSLVIGRLMTPLFDQIFRVVNCAVTWQTHTYEIDVNTRVLYKELFKMILLRINDSIQSYQFTRSYQKVKSYFNTFIDICSSPSLVPLYWLGEVIEGISNSVDINELNEKLTAEESNFSKQVMEDLEKLNELTCCLCS